jgi:pSer/pThr/pTyr-binding forkhead associated (FHA) protein
MGASACPVCKSPAVAKSSIRIGRAPDNDIVLSNDLVGRYHATITFQGGVYTLTDNQSRNGTFLNGQRITISRISPGDKIRLANVELLDWDRISAAFYGGASQPQSAQASPLYQQPNDFGPRIVRIGRASDNDIVFSQQDVSRHHAELALDAWVTGGGIPGGTLRDLGSKAGTTVNGIPCTGPTKVSSRDRIMFGSSAAFAWSQVSSGQPIRQAPYIPPVRPYQPDHMEPQPRLPEAPPFLPPPSPVHKSSPVPLILGIVAAVIVLLVGYFYISGGSDAALNADNKEIKHSGAYPIRQGEPPAIAMRRARIEAQREILEKTKGLFPNTSGVTKNYTIFPVTIPEVRMDDLRNEVRVNAVTQMNNPDFLAKMDYLNKQPVIMDQVTRAQSDWDANYELMNLALDNLELASAQGYQDYELQEFVSSLDESIGALESILQQLDPLKTEVANVHGKHRKGGVGGIVARIGRGFNKLTGSITGSGAGSSNKADDVVLKAMNMDYASMEEFLDSFETERGSKTQMQKQIQSYGISWEAMKTQLQSNPLITTKQDIVRHDVDKNTFWVGFSDAGIQKMSGSDNAFKQEFTAEFAKTAKYYFAKEKGKWKRYLHADDFQRKLMGTADLIRQQMNLQGL